MHIPIGHFLQKNLINVAPIRLLDCSYNVAPKPDYRQFAKEYYGQWNKLMSDVDNSSHRSEYRRSHLPGAIHIDLAVAMYPSATERYAVYPPSLFQEYIQLIGINAGDLLILYDRNADFGGMMMAAKFWWLFRVWCHCFRCDTQYGHFSCTAMIMCHCSMAVCRRG